MTPSQNKKVNIIYNGKIIYKNIPAEKTTEILLDIAEKCYDGKMNFELVDIQYVV